MDKKSERLKYIKNFIEMKKAVTIDEFFLIFHIVKKHFEEILKT